MKGGDCNVYVYPAQRKYVRIVVPAKLVLESDRGAGTHTAQIELPFFSLPMDSCFHALLSEELRCLAIGLLEECHYIIAAKSGR